MQFLKILEFFAIFTFVSAQGGFQKTALTKMNKYYNFVEPFLTIFVHPKENGKMMKVKIASLEDKARSIIDGSILILSMIFQARFYIENEIISTN